MGLLSEGKPLTWAETKDHVELVKRTGVLQFLSTYHRLKDRPRDELKWGDEVSDRFRNRDGPFLELHCRSSTTWLPLTTRRRERSCT